MENFSDLDDQGTHQERLVKQRMRDYQQQTASRNKEHTMRTRRESEERLWKDRQSARTTEQAAEAYLCSIAETLLDIRDLLSKE